MGNLSLDASPSTDPDNNALSYKQWQYHEADSVEAKLTIDNNNSKDNASFVVPNEPGKQMHVILEVTDKGEPALKSYQRVIINITENVENL